MKAKSSVPSRCRAVAGTASDGLLNIAANKQSQFEALCRVLGRTELTTDPRFAKSEARKLHREELRAEIERTLAAKPAAAWAKQLNAAGVPAGEVLSVPDALAHPQVTGRDFVRTLGSGDGGDADVTVLRTGFRLASGDPAPESPAPALGADTNALLQELGYAASDIAALRQEDAI